MEKISELMDGELDSREASAHLKRLKEEPDLRENWDLYHLVGDALRREAVLASRISQGVSARLAQEPTIMAPRFSAPQRLTRYALSAAAGLAGVAVVAWIAFSEVPVGSQPARNLAVTSQPPAVVRSEPAVPPAPVASVPSEVEDYLLAHQSVAPFRTVQGSLPYVRAAATEPR